MLRPEPPVTKSTRRRTPARTRQLTALSTRASISFERCAPTPKVFSVRPGDVGRLITTGIGRPWLGEVRLAAFLDLDVFRALATERLMFKS